jgi:tetratricopeptide (TPR) repeat protein
MSRTSNSRQRKPVAVAAPGNPRGVEWLLGAALLAAVVLAYLPAWHAGFIWDDDIYVTNNALLTAPGGLWRIWFSFDSPSQYFPLVYTTFRIEHALWGLAPLGYHCVNILVHGINAVLLWRLLMRLEIPGAWLAAAIFALHPVQVESVAWVTELKNVEMGFFFLLSLLAWTAFSKRAGRPAWGFYTLSLFFYALALCSKTTACTLPAALLIILWLRGERIGWRRLLELAPYVAMGLGMGLLTVWWERYHQGTQGQLFTMGLTARVLMAGRAVWFYLYKLFWPAKLTFSYPRWTLSPGDPLAWLWLLALCGLGWVAFLLRRRVGRGAFAALAFFAATLGPVLGFVMLYTFRYSFVADHYQYLACIGPIALVSAGVERLRLRSMERHPLAVPCLCALLLGALGLLTWRQTGTYRDPDTLWRATLAGNSQSWLARNNLGSMLFDQGRTDEALAQYQEAARIADFEETLGNIGNVFLRQGRTDDAIVQYRAALRLNPAYMDAHYNLGNAFLDSGRLDEAAAQYREALRLDPAYSKAHCNLGNVLLRQGRVDDAIAEYDTALRLNPSYFEALCDLGNALLQQGRSAEAIAQYTQAARLNPSRAEVHYNLGVALRQSGRADDAIAQYAETLRLDPAFAEAHNEFGLILYQAGRAEEAISHYRAALQIRPAFVDAQNNLGTALYKEGRIGDAITAIRKALDLQPSNLDIQNNLAWILATASQASLRDPPEAIRLATQASQSAGGGNPVLLRTLAVAYAAAGEFPDALKTAQKALQLAQARPSASLANALRADIALYQAGHPVQAGR